jgi:ABC-2 type transport system permease protein
VPPQLPSVARGYRFELVKLLSQWRIRALILVCWIVPAIFVAAVSQQSSLPADTLFGRWMHASGWAGSLVMLGFSGSWALPLLTSVVAGDVFSSEDRLGTWRHLLVAVRSPRRIFVAKTLASLTVVLLLVTGLAAASIGAGLAVIGGHPLVGIDGHLLAPADAAAKVMLAWACVLAPTLALAALGLIGSIALGRSPIGLLVPALVALAMQLAQMLPLPVAVRLALPGYAFIAWSGLFSSPIQLAPLLISIAVSLVWAAVATALAYLLFLRRDFTNVSHDRSARRAVTVGVLPLAALLAVTVLVLDLSTGATTSGIDQGKVQRSIATGLRAPLSPSDQRTQSPRRHGSTVAHQGVVQPGRRHDRAQRCRQRLALRHLLASPRRRRGNRDRHLPARRLPKRAVHRRR